MLLAVAGPFPVAASEEAAPAPEPRHFLGSDTSITLLPYGWEYVVDPAEQSTFTLEHVHASVIGDLFLFVDAIEFHGVDGGDGNTWYGEIGPRLSLGKVLDKDLSFVAVRGSVTRSTNATIARRDAVSFHDGSGSAAERAAPDSTASMQEEDR